MLHDRRRIPLVSPTSGTLGGIALCQVAVTLTVAGPARPALIGRALYLPEDRAAGGERRELAGVPDEVMFETRPPLAGRQLQHAHDLGTRAAFAAGDEVYGGLDLRKSIRGRGTGYVLAVRSNYPVTLPPGRRLAVKDAARPARPATWQRKRTGSATKGAKDCRRAMIQVTPGDTPDGHEPGHAVLLLRRHQYTGTVSYFLCWTPDPVPLARLIAVAVTRGRIEEDHQLGNRPPGSTAARSPPGPPGIAGPRSLIPVTTPELLRKLRGTVLPEPRRDQPHRAAREVWRRRHQYQAQQAHQRWHAYADALPQP